MCDNLSKEEGCNLNKFNEKSYEMLLHLFSQRRHVWHFNVWYSQSLYLPHHCYHHFCFRLRPIYQILLLLSCDQLDCSASQFTAFLFWSLSLLWSSEDSSSLPISNAQASSAILWEHILTYSWLCDCTWKTSSLRFLPRSYCTLGMVFWMGVLELLAL